MKLRGIPSIDALLVQAGDDPDLAARPRALVADALRLASSDLREQLKQRELEGDEATWVLGRAKAVLHHWLGGTLENVINATGVVLHTNLGRSPLAEQAVLRVQQAARGYSNLEFDLDSGERGSRYSHLVGLIQRLTGAESALVVNNNAAAMLLIVDELARGKEVICSRGELVEIGGAFRVPDVLARGGARLVEVGTTNKTYLRDYRAAVTADTGMLLSTHMSNFLMLGFTHQVEPAELTELGRELGLHSVLDLGSGLLDEELSRTLGEPSVGQMVEAGFDVVAFSGDKMLGGPQCGIVVGRQELIRRLARNPLTRALRVDKMTVAALEATLRLYLEDPQQVPVVRMLRATEEELRPRAEELARKLKKIQAHVTVIPGASMTGGGSLPGKDLPTWLVRIQPREESEEAWANRLRRGRPPVVVRRSEGALLVDPRTLLEEDVPELVKAFRQL